MEKDLYRKYFDLVNWILQSGNYYTHNNFKEFYIQDDFSLGTLLGFNYSNLIVYFDRLTSKIKSMSVFDLSDEVFKEVVDIMESFKTTKFKFVEQINQIVNTINFVSESKINFKNVDSSYCVLTYKFRNTFNVKIKNDTKKVVGITSDYKLIVEDKINSGYGNSYSTFELQHLCYPDLRDLLHHISLNIGAY